jgi:hypothetical protein
VKAQFKYTFLSGLNVRGITFVVIFLMNLVFVTLGALGLLPLAALITGVSLSGVAVSVMAITNVVSDIGIFRRLFAAPGAYLHALTPSPRWKTLLASVLAILIMDIVSMTVAITGVTWMGLLLAGTFFDVAGFLRNFTSIDASAIMYGIGSVLGIIGGYLLLLMIILSCIVVKKTVFYQKRAGGFLTALFALGIIYLLSLTSFLIAPFGYVTRDLWYFTIHIGGPGIIAYSILIIIQAFALFFVSANLMERKLNI